MAPEAVRPLALTTRYCSDSTVSAAGAVISSASPSTATGRSAGASNAGSASRTTLPDGSRTLCSGSTRIVEPGRTDAVRSGATGGPACPTVGTTSTVTDPVAVPPRGSLTTYCSRSTPGLSSAV